MRDFRMRFLMGGVVLPWVLVVAARWQLSVVREGRDAASRRWALERDMMEAGRDSTRQLAIVAGAETVHVAARRALQVRQVTDSLDRALGVERAARAGLAATIDSLRARATAEVIQVDSAATNAAGGERRAASDVRRAEFDIRREPYRVHAAVEMPPPPGAATMDVAVALDSLVLDVRVGCGVMGEGGVRPATVSVAGPRWAHVRLERVEQEERVCSPQSVPKVGRGGRIARAVLDRVGVSVGYFGIRLPSGVVEAGFGAGVSVRVWPE